MSGKIDYKSAGVDVQKGYDAVAKMKASVEQTYIPGVMGTLGGFGGQFELPSGYEQPVLVSGTDGVGTKLQVAFQMDKHDTIGIDCVAMCVNDIVCSGAKPLFFLDYIGTGILEPDQVADIVKGISQGCIAAGCALVGGETAEMPGFYKQGEYDVAGFSVGIVEKAQIIANTNMEVGNVILGLASNGLHSNGYSLARKLCFEVGGYAVTDTPDGYNKTIGELLLEPTRIYVQPILEVLEQLTVHGIAHITGGGWIENIPRMLPDHLAAAVTTEQEIPEVFHLLQHLSQLADADMYATFNMGIGMMLTVAAEDAAQAIAILEAAGEQVYTLGTIVAKEEAGDSVVFQ